MWEINLFAFCSSAVLLVWKHAWCHTSFHRSCLGFSGEFQSCGIGNRRVRGSYLSEVIESHSLPVHWCWSYNAYDQMCEEQFASYHNFYININSNDELDSWHLFLIIQAMMILTTELSSTCFFSVRGADGLWSFFLGLRGFFFFLWTPKPKEDAIDHRNGC